MEHATPATHYSRIYAFQQLDAANQAVIAILEKNAMETPVNLELCKLPARPIVIVGTMENALMEFALLLVVVIPLEAAILEWAHHRTIS